MAMNLKLAVGNQGEKKRESKMLNKTFRTGAGPGAKPEGEEASPEKKVQHKRHAGNTSFPTDARGVLNPNSDFRRQWDMIGFLMLIFVALVTPFEIAFVGGDRPDVLKLINWVVNLYFLFDLFLNFNTGYFDYKNGLWVTRRDLIAAQYIKSWCEALSLSSGISRILPRLFSLARGARVRAHKRSPQVLDRPTSVVPYDEILWLATYNDRRASDDDDAALDDELAADGSGGGGDDSSASASSRACSSSCASRGCSS